MSGNSWISYAAAVVVGVVVGYFAGPQLGYMAGMATLGVSSAIIANNNKPDNSPFANAAAEDLDIASASEAIPVPVIFGNVRMGGNFMRYDRDTFRAENVEEDAPGGKGGGSAGPTTVGFRYYLSYLYGLCMGSLDGIGRIWDGAEMKVVSDGFDFFSGDTMTRTVEGADMYGEITIFRGSDTQTPAEIGGPDKADTHLSYRHVAYSWMENFYIGPRPTPKTLLFEMVRWPVCTDDDGVPVPGLIVTGSNDDTGVTWLDANPAAIIYEIFTNKIWGRGMSQEFLDVPSFVAASEFFADNDLGLSLAVDTQSNLSDIVEFVQRHVASAVVWDGRKLRFTVLMNPADDAVPVVITAEQIDKPVMTRPVWTDRANEFRAEFVNKEDDWKTALAFVQDDAAINAIGGQINSQRATLNGFTHRSVAEAQALRILNEMCYPQAQLSFKMNRWASGLVPGQRVLFVWDEIGEQPSNTFWRVMEFSDRTQDADGIDVVLIEDLYAQGYLGEKQAFEAVPPAFSDNSFASHEDLALGGNANAPYDPGTMEPRAFELNIAMSEGARQFAVLTERGALANVYAAHYWRTGSNPFTAFASTRGWAITGQLLSAIPADTRKIERGAWGVTFTFDLTDPSNAADMLASANKVLLDTDDMANVTAGPSDLLIVGGEIFLVGKIVLLSPGVYEASNFIRAALGTEKEAHAINAPFAFVPSWAPVNYVISQGDIPDATAVDLKTNVATPQGGLILTEFPWNGPNAGAFIGLGVRPFLPGYISHTSGGGTWVVHLRPRIHGGGAQYLPQLADDVGNLTNSLPDGYGILVQPYGLGSPLADRVAVTANFIPADGADKATGVWNFTYVSPVGTDELRIWAAYRGAPSLAYLTITP